MTAAAYVPITDQERVQSYIRALVSPAALFGAALSAGVGQWRDVPPEWHQGAAGYGSRFASSLAEHVVQESILSGTAAVLSEDPRYIRSGGSGFRPRFKYALAETVMAQSREGRRRVSWSKIGALAGGAFLSRRWQPPSTAHPRSGLTSLAASAGAAAGFNVAHEFLPRLFRLSFLTLE